MSKRFLISEDERNSILSLYTKKGIILEQDRTNQTIQTKNSGEGMYKFGGYDLEVDDNQNIKVFDRYMGNDEFMGEFSGRFSDLKYDLETNSFADSNKVLSQNSPLLLKMIPNIRDKQTPSNNLGYFVALNKKNGFPTLYALTPIVVKQEQEIPVVDSTVIGLNQSYIPTRQTYGSMEDEIIDAAKRGKKEYTDLNFRKFRRRYAISLNTIEGPQGDGIVDVPIPPPVVSIEIRLDLTDPFKFDKTELTDIGKSKLEDFILKINQVKPKYGEKTYGEYINFLKKNKIKVTTSSSIDQDPNGKTADSNNSNTTTLESCRVPGGKLRKEYNKCLSEKRADAIIQKLTEEIPDLRGSFIPNAIGETDQFDSGKKWPNYKPNETVQNRRLDIDVPTFVKTGK